MDHLDQCLHLTKDDTELKWKQDLPKITKAMGGQIFNLHV